MEYKTVYCREEMIRSGIKRGLGHPETIKLSQQLDSLLIDVQRKKFQNLMNTRDKKIL